MSHLTNQSKESDKNINLSSNNNDDYIISDENNNSKYNNNIEENEHNNGYTNNINNQESINFLDKENNDNIENNNIDKNIIIKNININNFNEEEEENNNIINNNMEEEVEDENENEEMNLDEQNLNKMSKDDNDNDNNNDNNDDEELPLITLNFISVCQCCKTSFDNNTYLPYLLKCGHFFCIKCINEYFTDKNGIKCPSDGLIAKSINELTLLNNLIPKNNQNINNSNNSNNLNLTNINNNSEIIDNNINNLQNKSINLTNNLNYCPIHKDQKLSHVICDSNEIICVYCAFECFKKNPKCEIKELSTQLNDFNKNIDDIISNNQNEVLYLHDSLKKIKNNKENEEKAVNTFFECLFDYLNEKKNDYLEQINTLFSNNTKKLGDKLEEVTQNIDNSEKLKKIIENFLENGGLYENNFKQNYNDILSKYLILEQKNKLNNQKIELDEYEFIHIEEDKLVKNCQGLGEVKIINNNLKYNLNNDLNFKKNDNNRNKLFLKESNNLELKQREKENKNEILNENNEIINGKKEQSLNVKENNTIDIKRTKKQIELRSFKNKNINYIALDDISINNNNNNSYFNNEKISLKLDVNNENDNNYYINETNNIEKSKGYNIFNKKINNNIPRKNTFNGNNQKEKKVIIHKNAKSLYNYIEFPNYNTNLNNYNLLSKLNNNKKDKERNITVNNYEVHQTLKNSFNNNYNYGHNYNTSNYLNKLFEFNNSNIYGYNTNTNNSIQSNRKKFSFLGGLNIRNKNIKKFDFK